MEGEDGLPGLNITSAGLRPAWWCLQSFARDSLLTMPALLAGGVPSPGAHSPIVLSPCRGRARDAEMCGVAPTLSATTTTHARDEGDVWNSKGKNGGRRSEWGSHVERPFRIGVRTPKDTRGGDPNEWLRVIFFNFNPF